MRMPALASVVMIVVLAGATPDPAAEAATAAQPNIIFILADDLGYKDLGCYGSDLHKTPHIDRLASQGMRFTSAYAASHVCSPTRGSIQTGLYPARTRLTNVPSKPNPYLKLLEGASTQSLPENVPTLGELLKKEGYATAWLGKWHIRGGANQRGYDAGQQDWKLNTTPSEDDPKGALQLAREAIDFMTSNHDTPMFIGVSHYAVHSPVICNSKVKARYEPLVTPEKKQKSAAYAAMLEALDDSVGVLLKAIDDRNFRRDTVVIFFSDNGGAIRFTNNAPLREGKGTHYEGGIREPLIVRWPGKVTAGTVTDEVISSVDFLPTFLQMAGAKEMPKVLDGVSLVPVLTGGRVPREAVYWHFPHYHNSPPGGAIRKGNFKLIESFEDQKVELYDLSKDLREQHDLSRSAPEKAAELLADLKNWRQLVDAQMPKPNPDCDPAKAKTARKAEKQSKSPRDD